MDKPKVYFMDARSESPDTSLINKTVTVFEAAGFDKMINKGDVVVFPSYFLHRVSPVTKGTRYSVVAWAVGNKIR